MFLCLNDHARAEELRKDHPKETAGEPSYLECEGRTLLGNTDLLSLLPRIPSEPVERIRGVGFDLIDRGRNPSLAEEPPA